MATAIAGIALAGATAPTLVGALSGVAMMIGGLTQAAIGVSQLVDSFSNYEPVVPTVSGGTELVGYGISEKTGNPVYRAIGAGIDITAGMGLGTARKTVPVIGNIEKVLQSDFKSAINVSNEVNLAVNNFETISGNLDRLINYSDASELFSEEMTTTNFQEYTYEEIVTHVIKSGETLSQIAADYGLSVNELAAMNSIDDVDLIFEGNEIVVKHIYIHEVSNIQQSNSQQ